MTFRQDNFSVYTIPFPCDIGLVFCLYPPFRSSGCTLPLSFLVGFELTPGSTLDTIPHSFLMPLSERFQMKTRKYSKQKVELEVDLVNYQLG